MRLAAAACSTRRAAHAAGPARTCGDHDQLAAGERVAELRRPCEAAHFDGRADVRQVGGDARGVGDIVQRQLADERRALEQQRERLADAARGAEHRDLGLRGAHAGRGFKVPMQLLRGLSGAGLPRGSSAGRQSRCAAPLRTLTA